MLNFFKEILLISPKNRLLKGQFEYKVVRKFYFILLYWRDIMSDETFYKLALLGGILGIILGILHKKGLLFFLGP